MDKKICDECYYRMRAWNYDHHGQVISWDHCDHKDGNLPIERIKVCPLQQNAVNDMECKGFHIVIWEHDMVCMMDDKGNPAEVYINGKVLYPKKRN